MDPWRVLVIQKQDVFNISSLPINQNIVRSTLKNMGKDSYEGDWRVTYHMYGNAWLDAHMSLANISRYKWKKLRSLISINHWRLGIINDTLINENVD